MNLKAIRLNFFILGSIIGAGFASGQEINTFFTRFGFLSIGLAIICGYLFYLSCRLFLFSGYNFSPKNFSDVSKILLKNKSVYFDWFLVFCFCIVVGSMTAGVNEIGVIIINNYNSFWLGLIVILISALVTLGGLKAIDKINFIIVPIMVICLIATCVLSFIFIPNSNDVVFKQFEIIDYFMGIGSTILYVSLNMLLTGLVLIQIGKNYSRKEIKVASKLFGVTVTCLIILISLSLIFSNFDIYNSEMPIVAMSMNLHPMWGIATSLISILAIFTSIVSTLYVLANYFNKYVKNYKVCVLIATLISYSFSFIGFANIVIFLYPIMGVIGFVFIALIYKQNYGSSIFNIFERLNKTKNTIVKPK